jgi:hypothetical protein
MYANADGFTAAQKAAIAKCSKTSKGLMGQTIFYPGLNDFCRTYLDSNRIMTPAEIVQYPVRLKKENASIFEQLMLFDKISFKVYGENILVPFLISQMGQDAFESLLDQEAIGFTLWTPLVTHLVQDIPGVMALQSGTQSSPAHSDPEMSIELGLKWMSKQLFPGARRRLIKKLVPLYNVPSPNLSRDAVGLTVSAFNSGKLDALNFSSSGKDIQNLTLPERKDLCRCATELLEYSFLIQHEMTSFSSKQYFSLFDESASKVQTLTTISAEFNRLAKLEGFPDLKALYTELNDPFKRLPQLRAKSSSAAFRKWLIETSSSGKEVDITKEYVDSIAESKGFFETKKGKLTKSVVMTAIGTGIGALIGGAEGAVGGAAVGKTLEVGADWALDLIDEFLISGLTKGWSPRMFFDDLGKL